MVAAPTPGPGQTRGGTGVRAAVRRARARHPLAVQLTRYTLVAGFVTALNAALFLLIRPWVDAVPANLITLTVTTAVSTELNRRFAFGGARAHRLREWAQDIGTIAFYAGYSSGVLLLVELLVTAPTPADEAAAVAAASVLGGLVRFVVLRFWVFDLRPGHPRPGHAAPRPTTARPHG